MMTKKKIQKQGRGNDDSSGTSDVAVLYLYSRSCKEPVQMKNKLKAGSIWVATCESRKWHDAA